MSRQGVWKDERGFTLVELLLVIILVGIVMAIASSSWFGAVESRRVDSATNQLAADLRFAHSKAINRLAPQTVTLTSGSGSSEYTMTGVTNPIDLDEKSTEDLVEINTASTVVFNANGSATITGANPITVESSKDSTKNHTIEVNAATSRVQVVP